MRTMRETILDVIGRAFSNLAAGQGGCRHSGVHFNIIVIKDRPPPRGDLRYPYVGASKYRIQNRDLAVGAGFRFASPLPTH